MRLIVLFWLILSQAWGQVIKGPAGSGGAQGSSGGSISGSDTSGAGSLNNPLSLDVKLLVPSVQPLVPVAPPAAPTPNLDEIEIVSLSAPLPAAKGPAKAVPFLPPSAIAPQIVPQPLLPAQTAKIPPVVTGVKTADEVSQKFGAANQAQAKGDAGAVQTALDQIYAAGSSKGLSAPPAKAGAPAVVDQVSEPAEPKKAEQLSRLQKLVLAAKTSSALDAPYRYKEAIQAAQKQLSPVFSEPLIESLNKHARQRALSELKILTESALDRAAAGKLDKDQQEKVSLALDFWNAQLFMGQLPHVVNLNDIKLAIADMLLVAKMQGGPVEAPKLDWVKDKTTNKLTVQVLGVPVPAVSSPPALAVAAPAGFWDAFYDKLSAPLKNALKRPAPAQPQAPQEENLLIHVPRARTFQILGYRFHHLPPQGYGVAQDEKVTATVRRGASGPGLDEIKERVRIFNEVIENNFAALELITQNTKKMPVKIARAVHGKVLAMARAYGRLSGGNTMESSILWLGKEIEKMAVGLSDQEPLPAGAMELIVPLKSGSYHYFINLIHQRALEQMGGNAKHPANLFLRLNTKKGSKVVEVVDISNNPLVQGGRVVSPALKALVNALRWAHETPKGTLIMEDHQFWGHFRLGSHTAEIYANFLPPDEGGMIRIRYQEWGSGRGSRFRLYYLQQVFEKLGFSVDMSTEFLTAVIDKDHRSQSVDQMMETCSVAIQSMHGTVGLDNALPMITRSGKNRAEKNARIDDWVRIVLAEGSLPFYNTRDDAGAMVEGYEQYLQFEAERGQLRGSMNRALAHLGLPPIPLDAGIGQRAIDTYYNEPIEKGIARGEFEAMGQGQVVRNPAYDPLGDLVIGETADDLKAVRMAQAVGSLDPGLFEFKAIGTIGQLVLSRAQRKLDSDAWLILYVLRDPQTGQIAFAKAQFGRLGSAPMTLAPRSVFALLSAQGHPVAEFTPSPLAASLEYYAKKLKSLPAAVMSVGVAFSGLAASPGLGQPVLARATYDRVEAAKGGYIYIAPYTEVDDVEAIANSKAVVTTSGGLLSHAGITTREMDIAAVILGQARWKDGGIDLEAPVYGPRRLTSKGLPMRPVVSVRQMVVGEGDIVRVDPVAGTVEVFPPQRQTVMRLVTEAMEAYDSLNGQPGRYQTMIQRVRAWMKFPRMGEQEKLDLARELVVEFVRRATPHSSAAADLSRLHAALHEEAGGALAERIAQVERQVFERESAAAVNAFRETVAMLKETDSSELVDRVKARANDKMSHLGTLALALGLPANVLTKASYLHQSVQQSADARLKAIFSQEIAELENHALHHPHVTREVIPRLKTLIAKAKWRKLPASLYEKWEKELATFEEIHRRSRGLGVRQPTLALADILDIDVAWVGGKAAKLGEIGLATSKAGGNVPHGLALTITAYERFLAEAGIDRAVEDLAMRPDLQLDEKSAQIRRMILKAPLSPDSGVGREIINAVRKHYLDSVPLAVRSSAVDEDGALAAFAGAGDTHLYARYEDILSHVKEIWASLYNPRALLYRYNRKLSLSNLKQAVVIQAMVDSEISGVAFTRDPVTGHPGRLVVNAAWGLGEGIVSGRVAPDQYVLAKRDGREILPAMIADKKIAIMQGEGGRGTVERRVPPDRRRMRSLSPKQLQLLNTVATALERHFGYGLDIEFAFVGDKLYILQARPITAQAAPRAPPKPKTILFVCTGNTCRSPMAEYLLKDRLKKDGVQGINVISRGVAATEGWRMEGDAVQALGAHGIDGRPHVARYLEEEDLASADLILAMESGHVAHILKLHPSAAGKIFTLKDYAGLAGGDVDDPLGGGEETYQGTAAEIKAAVDKIAARLAAP